jgi:hypothetical protein
VFLPIIFGEREVQMGKWLHRWWSTFLFVAIFLHGFRVLVDTLWSSDDKVVLKVPVLRPPEIVVPYDVTVRRVQIDVDYDVSVSKLIALGKYHAAHHEYTDAKFPIEEHGRKKVDMYLLQFDRKMSGNEVWERTRKLGFYSASVFELLTLGAQHPDVQRSGAIFCLGYESDNVVPFLATNASGQRLAWILHAKRDYVYQPNVWFAVVKLE